MICNNENGGHHCSNKSAVSLACAIPYGNCGSFVSAPTDACNALFSHDNL